jgi:glycerophosphoryl diester phosphodiesterase
MSDIRRVIGFAHRGARSEQPENTLPAFQRALDLGASGLESDAWITADGVVVLDHDGVLGPPWRRRPISTARREELPSHIPSLEELFSQCGTRFELSLDVKDPAALLPLLSVGRAAGAAERLWLCYSDWRIMAAWRPVAPECRLVESTNIHWMREGLSARASALAAAGIDAVNLHRTQWDPDRLREVRAAGLYALAWDVQTAADLAEVVALGVDGVYSDHVDRLVEALASGAA